MMKRILVAVEDEPYPNSPEGKSQAIKLEDWLALSREFSKTIDIDVRAISELGTDTPDVVEAFTNRHHLLTETTFLRFSEHRLLDDITAYWPAVQSSNVPAIGILDGIPQANQFPIFVRGKSTSLSNGKITSIEELKKQHAFKMEELILRPFANIEPCLKRASVRKELRVHVVFGEAVATEFLFPMWAAQKPTLEENSLGQQWAKSISERVQVWSKRIADKLHCRWFTADFAQTSEGPKLIELNPGWCSGVTTPETARAIHLRILHSIVAV